MCVVYELLKLMKGNERVNFAASLEKNEEKKIKMGFYYWFHMFYAIALFLLPLSVSLCVCMRVNMNIIHQCSTIATWDWATCIAFIDKNGYITNFMYKHSKWFARHFFLVHSLCVPIESSFKSDFMRTLYRGKHRTYFDGFNYSLLRIECWI